MIKKLDPIVSILLICMYIIYKHTSLIDEFANEAYFLSICFGFSYFMYRTSINREWVALCVLTVGYSFFGIMGLIYIHDWIILGRAIIAPFTALSISVPIGLIVITIKYIKHKAKC